MTPCCQPLRNVIRAIAALLKTIIGGINREIMVDKTTNIAACIRPAIIKLAIILFFLDFSTCADPCMGLKQGNERV